MLLGNTASSLNGKRIFRPSGCMAGGASQKRRKITLLRRQIAIRV
jgi:hypothetical protein